MKIFENYFTMKRTFLLVMLLGILLSCNKDKFNNENPFLPNYAFSMNVDMNLPLYSGIQNPGNAIKVYPANGPARGVIIFNSGSEYKAYDGSCPNQEITSCSVLTYTSSNAVCGCDNSSYNMFTGLCAGKDYPLKQYRTEVNGLMLRVFN